MGRKDGFSLLELLIVVAIIAILMSMYLTTFGKVQRKANQVAAAEGMRQGRLGRMADDANAAHHRPPPPTREECRAAFREEIGNEMYATRVLYRVRDDAEFEAYYFTLIDSQATDELEFDNGRLVATDRDGSTHFLKPIHGFHEIYSYVPISWEYLSTYPGDMNGTGIGGDVMWGDGHVEYLHYPGEFPMTETVATLGRRFILDSQRD